MYSTSLNIHPYQMGQTDDNVHRHKAVHKFIHRKDEYP